MTKPYTSQQIRDQFFEQLESMVDYWSSMESLTVKESLEGLVHSILVMIDGSTELPAFRIAVDPHPDDRAYYESHNEPWYPDSRNLKLPGEITDRELFSEYLHHEWARRRPAGSE